MLGQSRDNGRLDRRIVDERREEPVGPGHASLLDVRRSIDLLPFSRLADKRPKSFPHDRAVGLILRCLPDDRAEQLVKFPCCEKFGIESNQAVALEVPAAQDAVLLQAIDGVLRWHGSRAEHGKDRLEVDGQLRRSATACAIAAEIGRTDPGVQGACSCRMESASGIRNRSRAARELTIEGAQ